jgi:hypothetical protein
MLMLMSMRMRVLALTVLIVAGGAVSGVGAYLKLGVVVGGRLIGIEWTNQPIQYRVTTRDVPGVTAGQLQTALDGAFAEWARPAGVAVSSQFAGFTSADPFVDDGWSVIGFDARPELDRTLGAATFVFDDVTGEILESDIFLNSAFEWSVASNGEPGRFDVESILVHEVGHLLGLGHSALGETELIASGRRVTGKRAVMFPIAYGRGSIEDRTIEADDIAGITDIYGTAAARRALGAIVGRVTLNGAGVFGAHVTAFNPATGDLVAGFTLNSQGDFVIAAMKPGIYIVRAEPLDDADLESFFEDDTPININFQVGYHATHVAVPPGGAGQAIEIKVRAK